MELDRSNSCSRRKVLRAATGIGVGSAVASGIGSATQPEMTVSKVDKRDTNLLAKVKSSTEYKYIRKLLNDREFNIKFGQGVAESVQHGDLPKAVNRLRIPAPRRDGSGKEASVAEVYAIDYRDRLSVQAVSTKATPFSQGGEKVRIYNVEETDSGMNKTILYFKGGESEW